LEPAQLADLNVSMLGVVAPRKPNGIGGSTEVARFIVALRVLKKKNKQHKRERKT